MANPLLKRANEWINIEKEQPDPYIPVLLFCPDLPEQNNSGELERPGGLTTKIVVGVRRGRPDTPSYVSDVVFTEVGYYGDQYVNPLELRPTHWMPLPFHPTLDKLRRAVRVAA